MRGLTTIQLNDVLMGNAVTNKSYIGAFPGCVIPSVKGGGSGSIIVKTLF